MQITNADAAGHFLISGKLDIRHAGQLRDALVSNVLTLPSLSLDLTRVEECDAIGLQLIWSARRWAVQSGKRFAVTGASTAFLSACSALGLPAEEVLSPITEEL